MMGLELHEWFRLLNVIVAVFVLVLGVLKFERVWDHLHVPARLFYVAFLTMVFAIQYGSAENLALNTAPGPRIYITTASLVIALAAFLWPDDDLRWMTFWRRRAR